MAKDNNYVEIVRHWDSSEAENLGKYIDPKLSNKQLNPQDVRLNYIAQDPITREEVMGTMPENPPEAIELELNEEYIIPFGRHTGLGTVKAKSLADYTPGTAGPENIDYNYVAWVNGQRVVGTKTLYENEQIATATEDTILEGYDAWVNRHLVKGKIPILPRQDVSLIAGQEYTFPYGLSGGTTVIAAVSLADQTVGSSSPDRVYKDDIVWVNGERIVGTFDPSEYMKDQFANTDALASDVREGKQFYSAKVGSVAIGTTPDFSNQEPRELRNGESITVQRGFYDGSLKISVIPLASVTIASATENTILEGSNAWVNGVLVEGKAHQYIMDATDTTATEYDISEGKTAYIDGHKVTGRSKYNTVDWYSYDTNMENDDDVNIPMAIAVPIDNWDMVRYIRIDIYDDNKLNILNHIVIQNYMSEDKQTFDNDDIIVDSDQGSNKIYITDNRHRYLGVTAIGYTPITE